MLRRIITSARLNLPCGYERWLLHFCSSLPFLLSHGTASSVYGPFENGSKESHLNRCSLYTKRWFLRWRCTVYLTSRPNYCSFAIFPQQLQKYFLSKAVFPPASVLFEAWTLSATSKRNRRFKIAPKKQPFRLCQRAECGIWAPCMRCWKGMESFIFGAKNKCQMTEGAEIGSLPKTEQGPYLVSFVQAKTLFHISLLKARLFFFLLFFCFFVCASREWWAVANGKLSLAADLLELNADVWS